MTTLLLFMVADYLTGLIVAGVFKNSPKTPTGALQSKAGLIGLIKKGMIMLVLLIACRLDMLLNTTIIRDGTCISFILNELISITENAGLMGVPILAHMSGAENGVYSVQFTHNGIAAQNDIEGITLGELPNSGKYLVGIETSSSQNNATPSIYKLHFRTY